MTTLTEGQHAGGFLVSEANGSRSREQITVLDGEDLPAGAVLGKITASGKYVAVDPEASDGSEEAAGILFAACHADGADAQAVGILRDAEVNEDELDWSDLNTTEIATATAELLAIGILMR
jgi:hypothetical protein